MRCVRRARTLVPALSCMYLQVCMDVDRPPAALASSTWCRACSSTSRAPARHAPKARASAPPRSPPGRGSGLAILVEVVFRVLDSAGGQGLGLDLGRSHAAHRHEPHETRVAALCAEGAPHLAVHREAARAAQHPLLDTLHHHPVDAEQLEVDLRYTCMCVLARACVLAVYMHSQSPRV